MKFNTYIATIACLTAFSLPGLAADTPEFDGAYPGPGPAFENPEMMPPPPPVEGEMEPLAMLPDEGLEMAAFPLSASATGGAGRMKFSDDQLEKMYSLKNKLADETGATVAELAKQKRHLKDLLTKPELDRSAITATQDKINKLSADLSNSFLSFKMDLMEQFTPEQKQAMRYKSLKRGRMGGFKHTRHGGPGMHGGGHRRAH